MNTHRQHIENSIKHIFSKVFALIFFLLAVALVVSLIVNIATSLVQGNNGIEIFLSSINTGIIALAIFELSVIINTEYADPVTEKKGIPGIQRSLPKFIGMVCVALSLEGLIMVIKYSQLELAGNLYYPVAIICSTALLLAALGLFIFLSKSAASTLD